MTSDPAAARLRARQAMLGQLTTALEALVRRLGVQRESALGACALAPQAEAIATQARLLAFGRGQVPPQALAELAGGIAALAEETAAIVAGIERGAALAGAVASALSGHVAELARLARDPAAMRDPAALHRVLGALAGTLEEAAAKRQGQDGGSVGLAALARQAAGFAALARRWSTGGTAGLRDDALRLSRDLGSFAAEAVRVAEVLGQDAAAGEKAVSAMATGLRGMAAGGTPAAEDTVDARIAGMVQGAGTAAMHWQQRPRSA